MPCSRAYGGRLKIVPGAAVAADSSALHRHAFASVTPFGSTLTVAAYKATLHMKIQMKTGRNANRGHTDSEVFTPTAHVTAGKINI